jgi:TRAP-type transport system small permease protein
MKSNWRGRAAVAMKWLVRLEQATAIALLISILATMALQVIARYIFQSPMSWSEEIARLSMIWLTFIASGFVAAHHQHITVDLFGHDVNSEGQGNRHPNASLQADAVADVNRSWRTVLITWLLSARLAHSMVLVSTLLLLIGGLRFVWRVYPVGSPSVGISMTYWYGAATIGLGLIALHAIADLLGVPRPRSSSGTETLPRD